jgi:two-component system sensor histidine kinase ResE
VFIFKSVVGKLWLTIIALVAVVLLILSLFLGQMIESVFANTQDQLKNLERMAEKAAGELADHADWDGYIQFVNELISAQEAKMIFVRTDYTEFGGEPALQGAAEPTAAHIYTRDELSRVFRGERLDKRFAFESAGNGEYIAVAVPYRPGDPGGASGAVVLFQAIQPLEYTQWHVKLLFFYVSVIGFLLTTFFAFFLSTRITKPLLQLKKAADLITLGEYGTRVPGVPVDSTDEIGDLAKTFNRMAQELQETIRDLNHEKEHLSSVLRSMTDAVITFDAEGRIILTNPQGNKIIEDWKRIHWSDDSSAERDDSAAEEPADSAASADERRIPAPLRPLFESVVRNSQEHTTKLHVMDGVWSVVMTPLYSQEAVRGAVAVLRDVTEEFRLDKLRNDFLANVSHELRTPISMMQGYSEALLDDIAASPEERRELVQVIYDESLRMGRLVADLLDLARMEAGHLKLQLRRVDVPRFIQRMHRKFSVLAKERGIRLVTELPQEELFLEQADEDRLEQVVTNLLDNAIRHTPPQAEIRIKAYAKNYLGRPAACIEVADQGQGIPAEDLPYIFERFYKADKARTRGSANGKNGGGTGLGLAIVKNIVEAHGGKVYAASTVGKGTTFSIMIPLQPKAR